MFKNDPNEKYTVWRCRSCGSLHSKEEIDLAYYYKYYPLKQHRLDFWARRAYNNRLKRLIKEGLKPEHEILDFGCGKGLFISYLKEKGYKNVIGYDAYVPEFSDEGILSRTYDVVVAQDVIEHVDDPMTLMDQLVRCLRLGGILCIGTPNADRLDLMHPEKFIMTFQQPYHRHILSEKALIQLGINRGLKIGKIYHRWYYDTLYPTVNLRFIQNYVRRAGNVLDIVVEPPRVGMVLTSPLLMFYAFFGYFFPPRTEMMIFFHQSHVVNNRQSGSLKEE
jgi:SAM-dependent methyltransferase